MGNYLHPGKQDFQMTLNSEIFIDKTEMIGYLNTLVNTQHRFVGVFRPRRFGKTMAADMICAYYDREADSRGMFEALKLSGQEAWDAYQGQFDVIRIVMTRFFKRQMSVEKALERMQAIILRDLRRAYPEIELFDENDLGQSIADIYHATGGQLVFVIDEWDAVFRERPEDKEGQKLYLDFLRNLLKDNRYIALAYMTGILPIKKYGEHSALNMFDEYSMLQPMRLAEFTGFTEDEVKELCRKYEMDFRDISNWYDGYRLTDSIPISKRRELRVGKYEEHKLSVYSPLSVVKAMSNGFIDNYWNKTETYEALAEYIRMDYDGLKETVALLMDGGRVKVNLKSYENDMTTFHSRDDILALLVHLGYLGYEGDETEGRISSESGCVFIPNREILEEFEASTKSGEWLDVCEQFRVSQEL